MPGWRKILAWEVEPEGSFKRGDIVRLKEPARDAAKFLIPPIWRSGTFEIVRASPTTHPYFPGEIAMVPLAWAGYHDDDVPPVYVVSAEDTGLLELLS